MEIKSNKNYCFNLLQKNIKHKMKSRFWKKRLKCSCFINVYLKFLQIYWIIKTMNLYHWAFLHCICTRYKIIQRFSTNVPLSEFVQMRRVQNDYFDSSATFKQHVNCVITSYTKKLECRKWFKFKQSMRLLSYFQYVWNKQRNCLFII